MREVGEGKATEAQSKLSLHPDKCVLKAMWCQEGSGVRGVQGHGEGLTVGDMKTKPVKSFRNPLHQCRYVVHSHNWCED